MDLSKITALRERQATMKADFDARKRIEWEQTVLATKIELSLELNRLKAEGVKISELMRAYGTKDRRTVLNLLALTGTIEMTGNVVVEPVENEMYPNVRRIRVDSFTGWTVDGKAGTPYSGSLLVYGDDNLLVPPIPETEYGNILHRELVHGTAFDKYL